MYLYTDMKGKLGVFSTKDFHSQIGIFKSCQYSTDSRIMFGGGAKYITKSQVRHSTVLLLTLTHRENVLCVPHRYKWGK